MSTLESIVRPFETRDVSPPTVLPASNGAAPDNVVLTFGQGGSPKVFNTNKSIEVTHYLKHRPRETSRVKHTKRITNPNDASQYVDVEVIDKLQTYDPNNRGQESVLTLNNQSDDDEG